MNSWWARLTGTGKSRTEHDPPEPEPGLPVAGNTRWAINLYIRLKDQAGPYENAACSPLSIALALASLHAGARDRTAAQLDAVLQAMAGNGSWPLTLAEFRAAVIAVAQEEQFVLGMANSLWAPTGPPFLPAFREALGRSHGAEIAQADFSHEEPARALLNQWFKGATRQLLDVAVARGALTPDTRLVSITALCFKGYWATPFGIQQTLDEPFRINPHTKIIAPMMWQRGAFPYGQFPFHFSGRLQVLELPYAGDSLAMVLLLPEDIEGIVELERTLGRQPRKLDQWLSALRTRDVDVALPKFTVGIRVHLDETLRDMGVINAFSRQDADFSAMNTERDLFVSHMLHQTLVAIDEYGTTNDRATSVGGATRRETDSTPPRPVPMFRADHPFLFLIRQRDSGQILVMGRVMAPTIAHKVTPIL